MYEYVNSSPNLLKTQTQTLFMGNQATKIYEILKKN